MQPDIHIFGLDLKTFGIVFACGFIAAGLILVRRLKELGKPVDWAYEMAFAALVGGLVGSRIYYIVENYNSVKHDLLGKVQPSEVLYPVPYEGIPGLMKAGSSRWVFTSTGCG